MSELRNGSDHQFSNISDEQLLGQALNRLEVYYGPQRTAGPVDPYLFLVWWHCGYPASDASCGKGWEALKRRIGSDPENILAASTADLVAALKAGGMVPETRADRLREIADRALHEFESDILAALRELPVRQARSTLKTFPGIADPGADRILLFGGIAPVAAIPSNAPQVAVRLLRGVISESYSRNYADARKLVAEGVAETFEARTRAYLLLKQHGEQVCKRATPKCTVCPVKDLCAFDAAT